MEKYILIGLLSSMTIVLIAVLFGWLKTTKTEYSNFLNNLSTAKPSELKGNIFKNQRYELINKFKIMKKYLGWSIFLLTIVMLTLSTIIVVDSRDFFKEFFEMKKNKIMLATETSVDSLLNIINITELKFDSVLYSNKNIQTNLENCINENEKIIGINKSLDRAITHQNVMIEKLINEKQTLNKIINDLQE